MIPFPSTAICGSCEWAPAPFETATGVHAAAVIKALKKKDPWLADRVYSGVPASEVGLSQRVRIGPLSGRSNVISFLNTTISVL